MKQRVTEERALQVARDYKATRNLAELIRDVSGFGWHFGKYSGYNRKLFTRALIQALDKGSNRATAQRVSCSLHKEPVKCPGCNWEAQITYWLGPYASVEDACCASCFVEALVTERSWII